MGAASFAKRKGNEKGQILIEVALVMLFIGLVFVAALTQFGKAKDRNHRYQFTQEKTYGKTSRSQVRY